MALMGEMPVGAVALCSAQSLPDVAEAPEWIHLLPAGPVVETYDGRGPYRLTDPAKVVTASLQAATDRGAVLDENHSTDLAAPRGEPAPARGHFTDFEARADGIWGKVDWTGAGKALMADRAYRRVSAVILHDERKNVLAVVRASLVNKPNVKGLTALNQESEMDLLARLIAALKLKADTSEDALVTAVTALQAEAAGVTTALQAQLAPIAKAAGLADGATAEAVLGVVAELKAKPAGGKTVEALQAELNTAVTRINELEGAGKKAAAEKFVDAAIAGKRAGVSARRDEYIALHMENPARAESLINGLPALGPSGALQVPPKKDKDGKVGLDETHAHTAALLGIDPKKMARTLAAEGQTEAAV